MSLRSRQRALQGDCGGAVQGIVKLPFEDRHHQLAAVSTRRVLP